MRLSSVRSIRLMVFASKRTQMRARAHITAIIREGKSHTHTVKKKHVENDDKIWHSVCRMACVYACVSDWMNEWMNECLSVFCDGGRFNQIIQSIFASFFSLSLTHSLHKFKQTEYFGSITLDSVCCIAICYYNYCQLVAETCWCAIYLCLSASQLNFILLGIQRAHYVQVKNCEGQII